MRIQESKRYNIIISGVRSIGGTDDNTLVRSILDEINIIATVASCRRIPTKSTSTRPQLLLVSFSALTLLKLQKIFAAVPIHSLLMFLLILI